MTAAHLVSTGLGAFFDGAAHFFVSIEEIAPTLAVAVLAGLRGPRVARVAVATFAAAWLAGGVVGFLAPVDTLPALACAALFLVPGGLLAWDRELPLPVVVALAVLVGAGAGYGSGGAMATTERGALGVLGAAAAVLAAAALGATLAVSVRAGWQRIVFRVVGSWVAALGLLSIGWSLRS